MNDIVVECGNLRYQPVLDRYIAGENVPFTEVQHVWRDTTVQQMCGSSGFYEQLFPLVRSLNGRLAPAQRLRVVAADPPIDWNKIHSYEDLKPFFDRDGSIASVMEREVLSKHRKALMLFGIFHLLHGGGPGEGDAVTRYERRYPGSTFVIGGDLGYYGTGGEPLGEVAAPGGVWPSLLRAKNSKLGSLHLDAYLESPLTTDRDCNVVDAFASSSSKTLADQIDAFLYLGPPDPAAGRTGSSGYRARSGVPDRVAAAHETCGPAGSRYARRARRADRRGCREPGPGASGEGTGLPGVEGESETELFE